MYSEIDDNMKKSDNEEADSIQNVDGIMLIKERNKIICCINIIGQIEGHTSLPVDVKTTKYEYLLPRLIASNYINEISGFLFILNTVGGDTEAGLAISELIKDIEKPTASVVLGGGHSIGIPLAVSAKRSFITKTATMTVHPVRMNGLVSGAPQTFYYFNNIQERIIKFVSENSSVSENKFRSLMLNTGELANDVGTILNGEEAVGIGLIDQVGCVRDAVNFLTSYN